MAKVLRGLHDRVSSEYHLYTSKFPRCAHLYSLKVWRWVRDARCHAALYTPGIPSHQQAYGWMGFGFQNPKPTRRRALEGPRQVQTMADNLPIVKHKLKEGRHPIRGDVQGISHLYTPTAEHHKGVFVEYEAHHLIVCMLDTPACLHFDCWFAPAHHRRYPRTGIKTSMSE